MSEGFDLPFAFHRRTSGLETLEVGDSIGFVHPCIAGPPSLRMFNESVRWIIRVACVVAAIGAEKNVNVV